MALRCVVVLLVAAAAQDEEARCPARLAHSAGTSLLQASHPIPSRVQPPQVAPRESPELLAAPGALFKRRQAAPHEALPAESPKAPPHALAKPREAPPSASPPKEAAKGPRALPVSPALQCVSALTICFFGVYLALVGARLRRTVADGKHSHPGALEVELVEAARMLPLVPMLCILLLSVRLRAMDLNPEDGNPQRWAQDCMYLATSAYFTLLLMRIFVPIKLQSSLLHAVVQTLRVAVTCLLYGSLIAIVFSMWVMHPPGEPDLTQPLSPALRSVVVLTALWFAQYISQEAVGVAISEPTEPATSLLQLPPMFCVLLLAIRMRQVQLKLEAHRWQIAAVYATTGAMVVQVICRYARGVLQRSSCGRSLAVANALVMAGVYTGILATLLSIHTIELEVGADHSQAHTIRPLSSAMKCVEVLTVVYFATYLSLLAAECAGSGSGSLGALSSWCLERREGLQRSLAFAPMLCVLMVAVRLRAMQLHIHDSQLWAQSAMYIAAGAVLTQVPISLHILPPQSVMQRETIAEKFGTLTWMALRFVATATLYSAVAVLLFALFTMHPLHKQPA